jgi:hypothetical protein
VGALGLPLKIRGKAFLASEIAPFPHLFFMGVGPPKAKSQMAEKEIFQLLAESQWAECSNGRIQIKWTSPRARSFQFT